MQHYELEKTTQHEVKLKQRWSDKLLIVTNTLKEIKEIKSLQM